MPFPHLSGTCYSPEALSVSVRSLPEAWGFALLTEIKFMQHSRLYSSVAFDAYITLSRPLSSYQNIFIILEMKLQEPKLPVE